MNRIRTAAAGVCAVVMLAGPVAVANADSVPRPTAPSVKSPRVVKPPPPVVCRFNWLGLTCFRLR